MKHLFTLLILTIIPFSYAFGRPLKEKDSIQLTVFGEQSLGATATIDSSGSVNFPLIGNIQVVGKSAGEVAKEVEVLLERDFIKDANVTVSVLTEYEEPEKPKVIVKAPPKPVYQPRPIAIAKPEVVLSKVTILGEVKAPGTISFEGTKVDILTIIAQVRGLTPGGNPRNVQIRRIGNDAKIFTVDINKLQASTEQVFIETGDTITVKKRIF